MEWWKKNSLTTLQRISFTIFPPPVQNTGCKLRQGLGGQESYSKPSLFNKSIPFYICESAGKRLSFSTNLLIIQCYLMKTSSQGNSLSLLLWMLPLCRSLFALWGWPDIMRHMLLFQIFDWVSCEAAKNFPRWPCRAGIPSLHFRHKGCSKCWPVLQLGGTISWNKRWPCLLKSFPHSLFFLA